MIFPFGLNWNNRMAFKSLKGNSANSSFPQKNVWGRRRNEGFEFMFGWNETGLIFHDINDFFMLCKN